MGHSGVSPSLWATTSHPTVSGSPFPLATGPSRGQARWMSAISGSPGPKHPSYLEGIQRQEGKQHPTDHPSTGGMGVDVPFPSTWCPRRAIAKAQPGGCSGITQAWELRQVQGSGERPVARPRQTETGVGSWLCLPPSRGFPFRVRYRGWFLLLATNNPDPHGSLTLACPHLPLCLCLLGAPALAHASCGSECVLQ